MTQRIGKTQFVQALVSKGFSKAEATAAVAALYGSITEVLNSDAAATVTLPGVATFRTREVREMTGYRAGKPMIFPAHRILLCKVSSELCPEAGQ